MFSFCQKSEHVILLAGTWKAGEVWDGVER